MRRNLRCSAKDIQLMTSQGFVDVMYFAQALFTLPRSVSLAAFFAAVHAAWSVPGADPVALAPRSLEGQSPVACDDTIAVPILLPRALAVSVSAAWLVEINPAMIIAVAKTLVIFNIYDPSCCVSAMSLTFHRCHCVAWYGGYSHSANYYITELLAI